MRLLPRRRRVAPVTVLHYDAMNGAFTTGAWPNPNPIEPDDPFPTVVGLFLDATPGTSIHIEGDSVFYRWLAATATKLAEQLENADLALDDADVFDEDSRLLLRCHLDPVEIGCEVHRTTWAAHCVACLTAIPATA